MLNRQEKLDFQDGSQLDIFSLGVIVLKSMGKLRLDLPHDLSYLMSYSNSLKALYKNEGMSTLLSSFLDILLDEKASLSKLSIHPFLTKFDANIVNQQQHQYEEPLQPINQPLEPPETPESLMRPPLRKSVGGDKTEFTFGSSHRNSSSSKSSETNTFPPEVKKFITNGSHVGTSSYAGGSSSDQTSFDYFGSKRLSDAKSPQLNPMNSPAVPLRQQERKMQLNFYPMVRRSNNEPATTNKGSSIVFGKAEERDSVSAMSQDPNDVQILNLQAKYRNTLKLNSLAEQPELNDTEEDGNDLKNISQDLLVVKPENEE